MRAEDDGAKVEIGEGGRRGEKRKKKEFFLMIRRPPGSPLFPYTTLFTSEPKLGEEAGCFGSCWGGAGYNPLTTPAKPAPSLHNRLSFPKTSEAPVLHRKRNRHLLLRCNLFVSSFLLTLLSKRALHAIHFSIIRVLIFLRRL